MTTGQMIDAVEVELDEYGLANRDKSATLLPAAIDIFLGANVWDFMIPRSKELKTVANQDYIVMPGDYYKVLSLRKPNYKTWKTNYIWMEEKRASLVSSSVKGLYYCQMGNRIELWPTPISVETYNFLGAVSGENLQLETIPRPYHPLIQQILLAKRIPRTHASFGEIRKETNEVLAAAIAIANDQPDVQQPVELDAIQKRLNYLKYGHSRGWPRQTLGSQ